MKLDLDLLRAFVAVIDSGTISAAAERTLRTQAAVSLQMRRLDDAVGARLLTRSGRRMIATEAGERLLSYARRMLSLHDEAVLAVGGARLSGRLRLGMLQDFSQPGGGAASALARMARAHPDLRLDLVIDGTAQLLDRLDHGRLDLVLAGHVARPDARPVATLPMRWLAAADAPIAAWRRSEVPLAVFEAPCPFRAAALAALDGAGIRWRIAVQSPGLSALLTAAHAGLAVTVRTESAAPGLLAIDGLPPLPDAAFALYPGRCPDGASALLAELLADEARNL